MIHFRVLIVLLAFFLSAPVFAGVIDPPLPDAAQEARAQELFRQLRCVVCESASIADSPSEIAVDMRRTVREKIAAGESEQAITQWLVERYGEHVLMSPPLESHTGLWLATPLVAMLGIVLVLFYFRRGAP